VGNDLIDWDSPFPADDTILLATFPFQYPLTVTPSGSGTVTSNDGYINCGSTCNHTYSSGTSVTLNASPASGWSFSGWSGACNGGGSCTVAMSTAQAVSATFTQNAPTYALTVTPSANGKVTSTDGYINCGSTCNHTYSSGSSVTLNASPASGWSFSGWSGACNGGGSCTVAMSTARAVSANFTQNASTYALTVTASGSGTVTSTDGYINCGNTCNHTYSSGTSVTLNASPASGWSFSGWSGACNGIAPCTVTMSTAQAVSATFTQNASTYALTVTPSSSGTVTSTDGYINCGGACNHTYSSGTSVTLNASPISGWSFSSWSGACNGGGSCTVAMSTARAVSANFTQNASTYALTVTASGSGTVTSTDGYINCGNTCNHTYSSGTSITLNASPASGWSFSGWSGACNGIAPCTVTMSTARSVSATFA